MAEGFDGIYVSDDYLEDKPWSQTRYWFQVDADLEPPLSFPICGRGVVHGVDQAGELCDVRISAAELTSRITFTERNFQGFACENTETGAQVTAVAPVVPAEPVAKYCTRERLAAMTAEELIDFAIGNQEPTGKMLDDEAVALLDCEWLRRFGPNQGIRETWERWSIPPSVPELKPLLDKNKLDLEREAIIQRRRRARNA